MVGRLAGAVKNSCKTSCCLSVETNINRKESRFFPWLNSGVSAAKMNVMNDQDSFGNLQLIISVLTIVVVVLLIVLNVTMIWEGFKTHKTLADAPNQIVADEPTQIVADDILETDIAVNYCPTCGTKIASDTDIVMNYCPSCGTKIRTT